MKIFWLDGGLHAEPETADEGRAMKILFESAKREGITGDDQKTAKPEGSGCRSTARSSEQSVEFIVRN
jgi:hypothetical protein